MLLRRRRCDPRPLQSQPIPLGKLIDIRRDQVPAEITHNNLAPAIERVMGVDGRDLGRIGDDVYKVVACYGTPKADQDAAWTPFDPTVKGKQVELNDDGKRGPSPKKAAAEQICSAAALSPF